jgi:histidinol-phosphate aminotransferase
MFIKKNLHLKSIDRIRVSEGRDLENGLRLDRNERVDNWDKSLLEKVLKNKPDCFHSTYPEVTQLYKKLSHHLNVHESKILLTSGIDGSIKNILEVLCNPGANIGVLSPTYAMYQVYCDIFRLNLFPITYDEKLNFSRNHLEFFLSNSPDILFIPNPNQPIESCLSIEELRQLANQCREKNCILVIDEAYHYFGSESSIPLIHDFDNVIVLRTFSKAFGVPSIRVGYTLCDEKIMSILSKPRLAHELSSLSIAIAEYLIDNFDQVKSYCEEIIESREFLKKELKKIGLFSFGEKGTYLFITFDNKITANKVVKELLNKKVYVKGPWNEPWSKSITISIGPKILMEKFLDNLRLILNK